MSSRAGRRPQIRKPAAFRAAATGKTVAGSDAGGMNNREDWSMDQTKELYSQVTGKTVETLTAWAEAQQRVLREIAEFTAGTAREGLRTVAEFQQNALKAATAGPVAGFPWQPTAWQESYQKAFRLFEENVQVMSRMAERVQASAEQAGKGIQDAFTTVAEKMKAAYSQN